MVSGMCISLTPRMETAEHKELRMLQRYTHPVAEGLARKTRLVSARVFACSLKTLTDSVLRKLTRIGSPTLWDTLYPTSPALLHEATLLSSVLSPSSL